MLTTPSAAYKESDGLVILGKRILVDVERGRTVRGWKPRRLGGGLGGRPKKVEAAPPPFAGPPSRGGFRGGFGGGGGGSGVNTQVVLVRLLMLLLLLLLLLVLLRTQ